MHEWFTVDRAAHLIGFDPDTIHDLILAGWIDTVLADGEVLICDLTLDHLRFGLRTLTGGS